MEDKNSALVFILHHSLDDYVHALRVASELDDERTAVIGALHDAVEDGVASFEELHNKFELDEEQMTALRLLTRTKGMRYFSYIDALKSNKMAVAVKLADLKDNIGRCAEALPYRFSLLKRYVKAYEELSKVRID